LFYNHEPKGTLFVRRPDGVEYTASRPEVYEARQLSHEVPMRVNTGSIDSCHWLKETACSTRVVASPHDRCVHGEEA
jgi:hypothetical protein